MLICEPGAVLLGTGDIVLNKTGKNLPRWNSYFNEGRQKSAEKGD